MVAVGTRRHGITVAYTAEVSGSAGGGTRAAWAQPPEIEPPGALGTTLAQLGALGTTPARDLRSASCSGRGATTDRVRIRQVMDKYMPAHVRIYSNNNFTHIPTTKVILEAPPGPAN